MAHKDHHADKKRVYSAVDDLRALSLFAERKLKGSEFVPNYNVSEAAAAMLLLLHQREVLNDFKGCTFEGAKEKLLNEHFVGSDARTVTGFFHYLDGLAC